MRGVLLLILAFFVIQGVRGAWLLLAPGNQPAARGAAGSSGPAASSTHAALPHEDQPQPAPAVEKADGDPLRWVSLKANGAGQPGAPALQPIPLVGNFDSDPDQECILFTPGGDYHWLCEADGSRKPLHLPGFDSRGCVAVDANGDGVDDAVPGSLAALEPGTAPSSPAYDMQGTKVGTVPWAGSRYTDPLYQADFDGKPGKEYYWASKQSAQVLTASGQLLATFGQSLPHGGPNGMLSVVGDFDGDGITDCFEQLETPGIADMKLELKYGNAAHAMTPAQPASEGRNPPMQHYCADVDGDGLADVIFPAGYVSHKRGWVPFAIPSHVDPADPYNIQGLTKEHMVVPATILAGDFDHDGKAEVFIACRDLWPEPGPDGKPSPYTEFWFFSPAGKLLRGTSRPATLLASDCWVMRAGGKDHLVLTYTGEVRISQ